MASNIEIKARASSFKKQKKTAEEISDKPAEIILQEDTFFNIPNGRFKLRKFNKSSGELIYYIREDSGGPKLCNYIVTPANKPDDVKKILSESIGGKGVVKKKRTLYKVGSTRIHFDEVEGLGEFIELEYAVGEKATEAKGLKAVENLMGQLGISESDLVDCAYIDLMESKG